MAKNPVIKTAKEEKRAPAPKKEKKTAPSKKTKVKKEAKEVRKPKEVTPETEELKPLKPAPERKEEEEQPKYERYFEAVGRRKTAIARVRLYTKPGDFLINNKPYAVYFPTTELQKAAEDSLQKMKLLGRFKVTVKVSGGGTHSQAEALRHGLARCLIKFNPDFRKRLKRAGFLTRDPRMKERKKFGLKGARKAPQWAKR